MPPLVVNVTLVSKKHQDTKFSPHPLSNEKGLAPDLFHGYAEAGVLPVRLFHDLSDSPTMSLGRYEGVMNRQGWYAPFHQPEQRRGQDLRLCEH